MNIDIKTADGAEVELGGAYYDGRGTEYMGGRCQAGRLSPYHRCVPLVPYRQNRRALLCLDATERALLQPT